MRRRVCMFTDSHEPSGLGEHLLTLATELSAAWDVSVVCPPTRAGLSFLARARTLDLSTLPLDVSDTASEDDLVEWLRARAIDVFHCHAGVAWEGHHGIYAARSAGVPIVVRTEHLPNVVTDPGQRSDHARIVELADRVICVSEGVRASFPSFGVAQRKVRAILNGIRPRRVRANRLALRRELGLSSSSRIALTVGRMTEQKGYDRLVRAAPSIVSGAPDIVLVWVGSGPLEAELRAVVREADLEARVRFLGRRRDVPALLAASDLLVLPSRFEGLPLVVLEAMAAGLPVVGTRACGIVEAVVDGETGRLVDGSDIDALADAVLDTVRDPARAERWGQAGRTRVARKFGAARMARETAALYKELLGDAELAASRAEDTAVAGGGSAASRR